MVCIALRVGARINGLLDLEEERDERTKWW